MLMSFILGWAVALGAPPKSDASAAKASGAARRANGTALRAVNPPAAPTAMPAAPVSRAALPAPLAANKPTIMAIQAALDRAMFSPGLIDGSAGRKTTMALRAFQKARGLSVTGQADAATVALLFANDSERSATSIAYSVTPHDRSLVGEVPKDWNKKAALRALNYESLSALLGERGRCTRATLARLNPGRDLDALMPREVVQLPPVDVFMGGDAPADAPRAAAVEVDISEKTVTLLDASGAPLGLFHCSVARFAAKRPQGEARVTKVALNPEYQFDPAGWPEVKNVTQKLQIPPGPRNPVGLAWIGLSLPGYGLHGTPTPELIGKTGSHGCIRLSNWDAVRLAGMVRVGTRVRFVGKRG